VKRSTCGLAVVGAFLAALIVVATTQTPAQAVTKAKPKRITKLPKAIAKPKAKDLTPFPEEVEGPYGPNLQRFANDLDAYWSLNLPKITGEPYERLRGYYAYSEETPPPPCGGYVDYRTVAGNAFYCDVNNTISFDNQQLFPQIFAGFGTIALGTVLAHEYGHAIQAQLPQKLDTVYAELQADCFSGAWLRHVSDGRSPYFVADPGVVDDALGSTLTFRDRPGVGKAAPNAHGNGFDRTSAVQLGFDEGPVRCAAFDENPPVVTATTYRFVEEAATGGDVPLDQAVSITKDSANKHFARVKGFEPITEVLLIDNETLVNVAAECPKSTSALKKRVALCTDATRGSFAVVSKSLMADAYRANGDVGAAIVLVVGWTTRVQQALGEPIRDASGSAELRSTCLAGTWLGGEQLNGSLSPGDIDEALLTLIQVSGKSSTFARLRALRAGFMSPNRLSACNKF
jgi:predicted metalloprotease